MSSSDRNPSPPPEILEKDENFVPDRIGSTVYSKRWLYKTLMNMFKIVQEHSSVETTTTNEDSMEAEEINASNSNNTIMELDSKIEEDACTLWDMSANFEVAEFLCECKVADSFLVIIERTKSPRLLEIVVGVLGNMSSFNAACEYISKNKELVNALIMLSGCSDSCTLVQLFRLLTCVIIKENCRAEWMQSFEDNAFFMENLRSILENNLCRDVLCGLLEFLDYFLLDPKYCLMWGEESYSVAIIESGKQLLKCNHNEDLDMFFTVVNDLCQQSSNVPVYGKQFETLRPIFLAYFGKLGDEEYLPAVARVGSITSAFALYGNLLFSGSVPPEHILFDHSLLRAMLNICKMVKKLVMNLKNFKDITPPNDQSTNSASSVTMAKERNGDALDEDDTIHSWQTLFDAVVHCARSCVPFTDQDSELQILEEIIKL